MTRARRAKWAALVAVAALSVASATIGVTQGAFAGQTSAGGNIITAMPDFRGPTITRVAIGKNTAGAPVGATGFLKPSATYRIYAQVTDVGTPPSGTATVIANVANVTAGQTAVPLTAGNVTAGGQTYNYSSAVLTSGALPNGPKLYTVTATDVAANVSNLGGSATIDNVVPTPTDMSASGGIAGRPEVGDVLTLTTNDTLDTFSLLANWTGAATPVQLRFVQQGGGDRIQVWNSAGTTQLPFGTINLGAQRLHDQHAGVQRIHDDPGGGRDHDHARRSSRRNRDHRGRRRATCAGPPSHGVTDRAGNAITTAASPSPRRTTSTSR